jgi:hypothetical protein
MITAFKCFTARLCPPIRGGDPVWDGTLPHQLPPVAVDDGQDECAAGWNACAEPHTALKIAGLWPDGWGVRLFEVETDSLVITRGDKLRAATWTITRECGAAEVAAAIRALSDGWFGDMAEEIDAMRSTLMEAVAESDEELMNKYFEQGSLTDDELRRGLAKGVAAGLIRPVLCGAGGPNMGVDLLLNAIVTTTSSITPMPVTPVTRRSNTHWPPCRT